MLLLYAAGAVVGPLFAATLMDRYDASVLFLFTAAVHLCLVAFAIARMCLKSPAKADGKIAFADALVSTATVANLERFEDESLQRAVD